MSCNKHDAVSYKQLECAEINSPSHYNWHPSGIECIEVIEEFPHNIAAAIGYLWRHQHKGSPTKDMKKAIWHIQREIDRLEERANYEAIKEKGEQHGSW